MLNPLKIDFKGSNLAIDFSWECGGRCMCFHLSSVLTFGRLLCSAGRCCLSLSRGGCLPVSDSLPFVWESNAVGFGVTWLKFAVKLLKVSYAQEMVLGEALVK